MVYLQLSENYKTYDKLRIKGVHYTQDSFKKLTFDYQIYKKSGTDIIELFSRTTVITDETIIEQFETYNDPVASMWDQICIQLIQHVITLGLESGTIESE